MTNAARPLLASHEITAPGLGSALPAPFAAPEPGMTLCVVSRASLGRRLLSSSVRRASSKFDPDQWMKPRSWTAAVGVGLVGLTAIWLSWKWIVLIVGGVFKLAVFSAFSIGALFLLYRYGSRLWYNAYGTQAPWVAPLRVASYMLPSARSVWKGATLSLRVLQPILGLFPALLRAAGAAASSASQRAVPVVRSSLDKLATDKRVTALIGSAPYEYSRPSMVDFMEVSVSGTHAGEARSLVVEFEVVGPRATGTCRAVAELAAAADDAVVFRELVLRAAGQTVYVVAPGSDTTGPQRPRVVDINDYEVRQ